jgi:hypothetical protein
VLVALAVVLLSVPVLAPAVEGQVAIPFASSPNACLGPGAVLNFNTRDWYAGYGAPGFPYGTTASVLANGVTNIGSLSILAGGGGYYAAGQVTLPANTGDVFYWTIRQGVFLSPPRDYTGYFLPNYDRTKWTCDPTLTGNTTCLPPTGGNLTFSGQVNEVNSGIDVGFDVDITQSTQPISNIIQSVGVTSADGTYNVSFATPPLSVGNHTFYVGNGSFDGPFYWHAHDRDTNRDGSDKILSWPIVVPCPSAALLITPGAFDFGSVTIGSVSGAVALNVVNVGTLAAPITGIALSGGQPGDFVIESNGCNAVTLAPNASCAVALHFDPTGAGTRAATLTASSSNTASAAANLTGNGVQPPGLTISPTLKNFGSVPDRGKSDSATFTVTNTGSGTQTITSVALTGSQAAQFAADPDTCGSAAIPGGGTCTVKALFQPTGAGARTAKLVVKSDANVSATATLRGTAQPGGLALDPNPADFGVVVVGTTSTPITVKLTNSSGAASTITAVHLGGASAGEFLLSSDSCTGQTFDPGVSCSIDVLFRPADAGDRLATLDIDDNFGTTSGGLHGVGIFQAILKFTPPVVSAGSLATVVGKSFPANTVIMLQWQEAGIHVPIQVTTDAAGAFRASFMIITGERLGPRHLEPAPNPGVLDEPRPIAALLVQAPTFRPQGVAIRSGGFSPTLVSRG